MWALFPWPCFLEIFGLRRGGSGKSVKESCVGGVALEDQKSLEGYGIIATGGAC